MRLTVLGGCGAWPEAGSACSGFLIEHDGFRLLADCGYATVPQLLRHIRAEEVDAVFVSHGHPDHCADLNPLLRARVPGGSQSAALPVYAPPNALDAVLALDSSRMLGGGFRLHDLDVGGVFEIGPFRCETRLLPHWVPNAGLRLAADGLRIAYTGDSGPSAEVVALAREADLLIADATFAAAVPEDSREYLTSAGQAARQAADAGSGRLLLTHLWPGTEHAAAIGAARDAYAGEIAVAVPGLSLDIG